MLLWDWESDIIDAVSLSLPMMLMLSSPMLRCSLAVLLYGMRKLIINGMVSVMEDPGSVKKDKVGNIPMDTLLY